MCVENGEGGGAISIQGEASSQGASKTTFTGQKDPEHLKKSPHKVMGTGASGESIINVLLQSTPIHGSSIQLNKAVIKANSTPNIAMHKRFRSKLM